MSVADCAGKRSSVKSRTLIEFDIPARFSYDGSMREKNRPSKKIVIPRTSGDKTFWDEAGAYWEKEGKKANGFGRFHLVPPNWDGTFYLVDVKDEKGKGSNPEESSSDA